MTKYKYIAYFGKPEVIVNEQPKPSINWKSEETANKSIQEWQSSCKTIPIAEGHKEKFKNIAGSIFAKKHGGFVTEYSLGFQKALESGIQIPSELVRFEKEVRAIKENNGYNIYTTHLVETAYFVEKEQETNEAELWDEVFKIYGSWMVHKKDCMNEIKSKFKITRKHPTK